MTNAATKPAIQGNPRARSIGAVLAGIATVIVLSLGTDLVMHALKIFPPWGRSMSDRLFVLATVYRIIYGICGAYITARLAPRHPMKHALINGLLGMVAATAAMIATWSHTELGPHWYPVALVATTIPCAWLGAKLYGARDPGAR